MADPAAAAADAAKKAGSTVFNTIKSLVTFPFKNFGKFAMLSLCAYLAFQTAGLVGGGETLWEAFKAATGNVASGGLEIGKAFLTAAGDGFPVIAEKVGVYAGAALEAAQQLGTPAPA